MSTLDTLARVARRQSEDVERELAAAEGRLRFIAERLLSHDRAVAHERALAQESAEAGMAFGAYAQHAIEQRRVLESERAALAHDVERLRDTLREAFIELKKIEILIEQEAQRAHEEEARRDLIAMDDVAAHIRREGL